MLKAYADGNYFDSEGEHGYANEGGGYQDQEAALRTTFCRFLQRLDRLDISGGAQLEIGAGFGYLLDQAREFLGSRP